MVKNTKGDLLKWVGVSQVIAHQTNCLGIMGGGVAAQIKSRYPEVYAEYKKFCTANKSLLGQCQLVELNSGKGFIANLFGQQGVGPGRATDYDGLQKALGNLANQMREKGLTSVAFPYKLGCGLAGGDWKVVEPMITKLFSEFDTTIVEYAS
ncbi:MAG: macro domain-containing protein [Treponema sp.]|jgi:O-acetyl-ADP-ribose deacetylase (regulator of RNase III)|nr:macro domain-containing protein [Treponema sp.]